MRNKLAAVVSIFAASLVASACSDKPVHEPTAPTTVTAPNLDVSLPPTFCDITALKAYARDYVALNKDPLNTIIANLSKEITRNGIGTGSTGLAFDGLARLAVMRGNSTLQKSTATTQPAFDGLVKGFVGCMQETIRQTAVAEDFGPAVGPGWIFAVRGGSADPASGAYQTGVGNPYWGAELATTPSTRFLIYGYLGSSLNLPTKLGSEIEIRTIPTIASGLLAVTMNIGLCNAGAGDLSQTGERLNHANRIVAFAELQCTLQTASAATTSSLNPLSLAHAALSFFSPKPAYAAAFAAGSVGGAVSELSPAAIYNLGGVSLSGLDSISDGQTSQSLHLVASKGGGPVTVVAKEGASLLEGMPVVMGILGNSSSIAFFTDSLSATPNAVVPTVTRYTDAQGVANFKGVKLTKAGGYQLILQVGIDTFLGNFVTSNSFNMQNK
jgi:hypothetical protein